MPYKFKQVLKNQWPRVAASSNSYNHYFLEKDYILFSRFWSQLISEFQDQNYSTYLGVRVNFDLQAPYF